MRRAEFAAFRRGFGSNADLSPSTQADLVLAIMLEGRREFPMKVNGSSAGGRYAGGPSGVDQRMEDAELGGSAAWTHE